MSLHENIGYVLTLRIFCVGSEGFVDWIQLANGGSNFEIMWAQRKCSTYLSRYLNSYIFISLSNSHAAIRYSFLITASEQVV